MADSLFFWIEPDAVLSSDRAGCTDLRCGGASVRLGRVRSEVLAALRRIVGTGEHEHQLVDAVLGSGGAEALAELYYTLHQLTRCRLLRRSAYLNGERVATLVPISSHFDYPARQLQPALAYRLSRFAYMRADLGKTVLESPTSHARLVLEHSVAARIVHALARPCTPHELTDGVAPGSDQMMTLLLNAGMLTVQTDGATSEDQDSPLRSWEFHDLLFHSRSRIGRHDHPVGASCRFVGALEQPASLKPPDSADVMDLYRPDLERLNREDPPLALVQETRRSIREYGTPPITVREVGEFLSRVGRVTRIQSVEVETPRGPVAMEIAFRPYPAGGALYELELYLAVQACEGLAAGLYRYLPLRHQLARISGKTRDVDGLLADAGRATRVRFDQLQILIVIGARFQRMSWKYSSIAYAATLKHVGVLYQTMYLAATAMRLAPCAIGVGDSDLFARAAGTDYYEETSVGEFLLGSMPPSPAGAPRQRDGHPGQSMPR